MKNVLGQYSKVYLPLAQIQPLGQGSNGPALSGKDVNLHLNTFLQILLSFLMHEWLPFFPWEESKWLHITPSNLVPRSITVNQFCRSHFLFWILSFIIHFIMLTIKISLLYLPIIQGAWLLEYVKSNIAGRFMAHDYYQQNAYSIGTTCHKAIIKLPACYRGGTPKSMERLGWDGGDSRDVQIGPRGQIWWWHQLIPVLGLSDIICLMSLQVLIRHHECSKIRVPTFLPRGHLQHTMSLLVTCGKPPSPSLNMSPVILWRWLSLLSVYESV